MNEIPKSSSSKSLTSSSSPSSSSSKRKITEIDRFLTDADLLKLDEWTRDSLMKMIEEEDERDGEKHRLPNLRRCHPATRDRTPRLVDGILSSRLREALIREIKDQQIRPIKEENVGKSSQYRQ